MLLGRERDANRVIVVLVFCQFLFTNASANMVFVRVSFYFVCFLCVFVFVMQASGAKASVGDRPHFLYGAHQRPHSGRIDVVPRQSSRCGGVQKVFKNTFA